MIVQPVVFLNVSVREVVEGDFRPSYYKNGKNGLEPIPYSLHIVEVRKSRIFDFTCTVEGDESQQVYQGVLDPRMRYLALAPGDFGEDLARWAFSQVPQ